MTTGQIQWQQNPQNKDEGVSINLALTCRPDGSIHMETPNSQGGFSDTYGSPHDAAQGLVSLFEQGAQEAQKAS